MIVALFCLELDEIIPFLPTCSGGIRAFLPLRRNRAMFLVINQ
jgi:hypothetical protein